MDPIEILSRCKLLFGENKKFDDMRRAVMDEDLNSIFRFVGEETFEDLRKAVVEHNLHSLFRVLHYDHEELRKAVTEQNLHSLFRLFGEEHEDFRKLVIEKNHFALMRLLKEFTSSRMLEVFDSIVKDKSIDPDCVSRSQIRCKKWMISELEKHNLDLGTIFLCAGWYGVLGILFFESKIRFGKIVNFDIDDSCRNISEKFNKPWVVDDWKYKHCTQNIHDINYDTHVYNVLRGNGTPCELTDSPDTIINTSCEHIENFNEWYEKIPQGKFVILQNNNYVELDEHINCVENIDELIAMTPMSQRLYHGELETPKYTRYMTFGYK